MITHEWEEGGYLYASCVCDTGPVASEEIAWVRLVKEMAEDMTEGVFNESVTWLEMPKISAGSTYRGYARFTVKILTRIASKEVA